MSDMKQHKTSKTDPAQTSSAIASTETAGLNRALLSQHENSTPGHILRVQSLLGNRFTQRWLHSKRPRPSLVQRRNVLMRTATDDVVPVRAEITITKSVGRDGANKPADVQTLQGRLVELGYLTQAAKEAETPLPTDTKMDDAKLAQTIAAIEVFQRDVMGSKTPDGNVGPGPKGETLKGLNRSIAKPSATDVDNIKKALDSITETVTTGTAITKPVGEVAVADVTAGNANLPSDVISVQTRLVQLGHLVSSHGEAPEATATGGIAVDKLKKTIQAIRKFQDREVAYWLVPSRAQVSGLTGKMTKNIINVTNDATFNLFTSIKDYTETFKDGESLNLRDHVKSPYTQNIDGVSSVGTSKPGDLAESEYASMGLTGDQTTALKHVSSHEGNFDALNTYDRARVSFGMIQFAGGRGLPKMMALLKSRKPDVFKEVFQTYGIDVEFNVSKGKISTAALTLTTKDGAVLRGDTAEAAISKDHRLTAVFAKAGHNVEVQKIQVEAATRDYVLTALDENITYNNTNASMKDVITSQKGLAALFDRSVQEGNVGRIENAVLFIAKKKGLTKISDASKYEADILQQVINDLQADMDIADSVHKSATALDSYTAEIPKTEQANAKQAEPLAVPQLITSMLSSTNLATARTELDTAITTLDKKSPGTALDKLREKLTAQRAILNFSPAPATAAALTTSVKEVSKAITKAKPDKVNAMTFKDRTEDIMKGDLTAPAASPATLGTPAPAPAAVP